MIRICGGQTLGWLTPLCLLAAGCCQPCGYTLRGDWSVGVAGAGAGICCHETGGCYQYACGGADDLDYSHGYAAGCSGEEVAATAEAAAAAHHPRFHPVPTRPVFAPRPPEEYADEGGWHAERPARGAPPRVAQGPRWRQVPHGAHGAYGVDGPQAPFAPHGPSGPSGPYAPYGSYGSYGPHVEWPPRATHAPHGSHVSHGRRAPYGTTRPYEAPGPYLPHAVPHGDEYESAYEPTIGAHRPAWSGRRTSAYEPCIACGDVESRDMAYDDREARYGSANYYSARYDGAADAAGSDAAVSGATVARPRGPDDSSWMLRPVTVAARRPTPPQVNVGKRFTIGAK